MAEKDILEKVLLSYADVFADCGNVLIYGGEERLRAEELQQAPTESFYEGKDRMKNQFCDISFYLVKNGVIKAQYIIENETGIRNRQVLRKLSYHGGAYREQLKTEKPIYPVVSMVIDWSRKSTRVPLSLRGLLQQNGIPEKETQLVEDVKLTLYHMKSLSKEVRDRFTSDIGFVADYLNTGSFENRRHQKIVHVKALCRLMQTLTGDKRFADLVDEMLKIQEERKALIMCEYIDMLEARGEARGKALGESRLAALLARLYSEGRDEEAKRAVEDEEYRKQLYMEFCIAN